MDPSATEHVWLYFVDLLWKWITFFLFVWFFGISLGIGLRMVEHFIKPPKF